MCAQSFDDSIEQNHANAIEKATAGVTFGHWIDGKTVPASSGKWFETSDPAVGKPIADVAQGRRGDIVDAVSAARSAFDTTWGETTPRERATVVREWVGDLREHTEELALLESLDTGKPLAHAREEIEDAFEYLEYYVSVAQAHEGSHLPYGSDNHVYIRNEPYGVAGQILPWNYPLNLFGWKVGAALAAGNTVVCKPSEEAPLSITRAVQLSANTLPDGVLNVVNGYGTEAGAPLTEHADVDKLSFTGSVPVGKQVMRAAAEHVTPVTLELGGKSPFIVFPDADIEQAAETSAAGIFYNAGQSCDACSRLLVHEAVREEFTDAFLDAAGMWEPGDPLADGTKMGPLTFAEQHEKVADYVATGKAEGATLIKGGQEPGGGPAAGQFMQPTVFDDVDNDMRIAQEEIFGPVQTIIGFSDYAEAIELANDIDYGLAAGVATSDAATAHRAAADIQAGSIWINEYHGGGPGIPFGGFKSSGIGRECAKEALDEYTHTKSVNIALDDPQV